MLLPFSYLLGGWMDLDLLIAITLNRSIIVSLSWYHNHYKYLPIHKMITVINTSDKRKNNENISKPPTTTTCFSQFFMFSMHKSSHNNYLFFPSFSLSSGHAPLPINFPCFDQPRYGDFYTFTCNTFQLN